MEHFLKQFHAPNSRSHYQQFSKLAVCSEAVPPNKYDFHQKKMKNVLAKDLDSLVPVSFASLLIWFHRQSKVHYLCYLHKGKASLDEQEFRLHIGYYSLKEFIIYLHRKMKLILKCQRIYLVYQLLQLCLPEPAIHLKDWFEILQFYIRVQIVQRPFLKTRK